MKTHDFDCLHYYFLVEAEDSDFVGSFGVVNVIVVGCYLYLGYERKYQNLIGNMVHIIFQMERRIVESL